VVVLFARLQSTGRALTHQPCHAYRSTQTRDDVLLGTTNSFEEARRRQTTFKSRKEKSANARRMMQQRKLADYQAKEDAKMQVFRDMVKSGTFQRL
jgi:hypothetical protein